MKIAIPNCSLFKTMWHYRNLRMKFMKSLSQAQDSIEIKTLKWRIKEF